VPRPDPHPVLNDQAAEALRLLSDPELEDRIPLPSVDAGQAATLVQAAAVHGTIAIAYRHLRSRRASDDLTAAFEQAQMQVLSAMAAAMRLRQWGDRISNALGEGGVRHAPIKGPVFAARLYRHSSDRLFTDIDIVVTTDSISRVATTLAELGFVANDIPNRDATGHCEFKWTLRSQPAVSAEVQTNLIHSARLRRRVSVDLDAIYEAGEGDPSEPTALLYVAGVHAASGHQFDRLALLVDIVQAVRRHSGTINAERLHSVSRKSGTLRAVASSLAVAGRMYSEAECSALAKDLVPGIRPIEWMLVSPDVILRSQSVAGRRVSWRRKVFRQLLSRPVYAQQS
jgi:Uncharacterised nucleotidyltransferase